MEGASPPPECSAGLSLVDLDGLSLWSHSAHRQTYPPVGIVRLGGTMQAKWYHLLQYPQRTIRLTLSLPLINIESLARCGVM